MSVIWVGTDLPAPILLPLLPPFSPSGSTFRDDSELIESGKGAGSVQGAEAVAGAVVLVFGNHGRSRVSSPVGCQARVHWLLGSPSAVE